MILPLKSLSRIASAMREGHGDVLNQSNFSSPNFAFLHDWCSEHKIQFRDNSDLIELPEVIEKFSREVKEVNKSLGEHEVIKRFRLVTEEWTPQTGELSPTLKLNCLACSETTPALTENVSSVLVIT